MLTWLDPQALSDEQWQMLCAAGEPAGWSQAEIAEKLLSRAWLAFATAGGVLAVERRGRTLRVVLLANDAFGLRIKALKAACNRLAADWQCDTVETDVFSERLMRAMMHHGAKPECWTMAWQVEG